MENKEGHEKLDKVMKDLNFRMIMILNIGILERRIIKKNISPIRQTEKQRRIQNDQSE